MSTRTGEAERHVCGSAASDNPPVGVLREGWEPVGREAAHVDHVTDDLVGFLERIASAW